MTKPQDLPSQPCASRRAPFIELQQVLPSKTAAISPFVDRLMHFLKMLVKKVDDADEDEAEIQIALGEALTNAVIYGNRENPHKYVYVTCRLKHRRRNIAHRPRRGRRLR